ncbi:MAG: nickel-binding protein [Acetobacteraceae bacterium]
MEIQRSAQPDGSASAFLVERYLPAMAAGGLAQSVSRVARICADQDNDACAVRYVQSLYLPGEDLCFCVFRARSSDAVRAVNDAGHFRLDRISKAVLMSTTDPTPADVAHGASTPPTQSTSPMLNS